MKFARRRRVRARGARVTRFERTVGPSVLLAGVAVALFALKEAPTAAVPMAEPREESEAELSFDDEPDAPEEPGAAAAYSAGDEDINDRFLASDEWRQEPSPEPEPDAPAWHSTSRGPSSAAAASTKGV